MEDFTPAELEGLRAKIAAGIRDAEEGRFVDDSDEEKYLADKLARLRERVAARGNRQR